MAVPEEYAIVTNEHRPYTQFWHVLPLRLLPDRGDQKVLPAFWNQPDAQRDLFRDFPRNGGLAPCRLKPGASEPARALDATCQTQISRLDRRRDIPKGFSRTPKDSWRTSYTR